MNNKNKKSKIFSMLLFIVYFIILGLIIFVIVSWNQLFLSNLNFQNEYDYKELEFKEGTFISNAYIKDNKLTFTYSPSLTQEEIKITSYGINVTCGIFTLKDPLYLSSGENIMELYNFDYNVSFGIFMHLFTEDDYYIYIDKIDYIPN